MPETHLLAEVRRSSVRVRRQGMNELNELPEPSQQQAETTTR